MKKESVVLCACVAVVAFVNVAVADATWLETDEGAGYYDYIEKDSTTWVHYGTDWSSWNYAAVYAYVGDGTGDDYAATWQHDAGPNKHLSSGDLNAANHGADWAAGKPLDLYCKVDDDPGGGSPTQSTYTDELMILDVQKTDISGNISSNGNCLVLKFKIDIGSDSGGRTLNRLWVKNVGTLEEGTHIANDAVKLRHESGSNPLNYDGTETSADLDGDYNGNDTSNEEFGHDSLGIGITAGQGLNCYVVIDSFAAASAVGKTAKFEIILDGMSLDTFGNAAGAGDARVRMDAEQNANALTVIEPPVAGSVFRLK